ncbi:MAG: acyltransferase [Bacteroidales bacterium]|nr:acyltransferase [Bacteroidales bacterium]
MALPLRDIFNISSEKDFAARAMEIFRYQAVQNPVYARWLEELGLDHGEVRSVAEIPFLPVSLFRDHTILTKNREAEKIFISSGTRGMRRSNHYVADTGIYERSFSTCFSIFYGSPGRYVILALLPSYLEQKNSSLVYMVKGLIALSGSPLSGFVPGDIESLQKRIALAGEGGKEVLLLGVSYALLDLAEKNGLDLQGNIVMETGGMKGRRKEMTREELHSILIRSFGTGAIHSEYGMTELLSQAYSKGGGLYYTPPWMKILIRDPHDPFALLDDGSTGGVNIIDLANIHSCSFIETSDLGVSHPDGSFEIVGRFDNADIRGCNLLMV